MLISEKEIKRIATLSRLNLSKDDIMRYQKDLASILAYVDILKEAKVEDSLKNLKDGKRFNIFRQDEKNSETENENDKTVFLESAPDKKDKFFRVPAIF